MYNYNVNKWKNAMISIIESSTIQERLDKQSIIQAVQIEKQ